MRPSQAYRVRPAVNGRAHGVYLGEQARRRVDWLLPVFVLLVILTLLGAGWALFAVARHLGVAS